MNNNNGLVEHKLSQLCCTTIWKFWWITLDDHWTIIIRNLLIQWEKIMNFDECMIKWLIVVRDHIEFLLTILVVLLDRIRKIWFIFMIILSFIIGGRRSETDFQSEFDHIRDSDWDSQFERETFGTTLFTFCDTKCYIRFRFNRSPNWGPDNESKSWTIVRNVWQ